MNQKIRLITPGITLKIIQRFMNHGGVFKTFLAFVKIIPNIENSLRVMGAFYLNGHLLDSREYVLMSLMNLKMNLLKRLEEN